MARLLCGGGLYYIYSIYSTLIYINVIYNNIHIYKYICIYVYIYIAVYTLLGRSYWADYGTMSFLFTCGAHARKGG